MLVAVAGAVAIVLAGRYATRQEDERLQREERGRAEHAVELAARQALDHARNPSGAPLRTWQFAPVASEPTTQDNGWDALVREAEHRELVQGKPEAALELLTILAGDDTPTALRAALRAGALLRRLERGDEADAFLARAATAPPSLADRGVPVRTAAAFHLALGALDGPHADERERQFLATAGDGWRLATGEGVGPAALVEALAHAAAERGTISARLAAARARAQDGLAWQRRLTEGSPQVHANLMARIDGTRIEERSIAGTVRPVAELLAQQIDLVPATIASHGSSPFAVLPAPLDAYAAVAPLRGAQRAFPLSLPWLAAGLVYALGAGLAIAAVRRHLLAARMQGEFVAAVSHELKTPITSVRAMSELLAGEGPLDEERTKTYAARIEREMRRLGETVANVLDAARIERQGAVVLDLQPLDPRRVVAEALEPLLPELERRGFLVSVDLAVPGASHRLDGGALRSVVANLLENAHKHAGDVKAIDVCGTSEASGHYAIEVADRGIGFEAGEAKALFQRFYRSARAVERALPGLGLGLFVADQIVRAHGGTIEAAAREGGGAVFRLRLPPSVLPAPRAERTLPAATDASATANERLARGAP